MPGGRQRLAPDLAAALARTGGSLVSDPAAAEVTVAVTRDAAADPAQRRLVSSLTTSGPPAVVVAIGLPYDLGLFPAAAAGLATCSAAAVSLAAAAAAHRAFTAVHYAR